MKKTTVSCTLLLIFFSNFKFSDGQCCLYESVNLNLFCLFKNKAFSQHDFINILYIECSFDKTSVRVTALSYKANVHTNKNKINSTIKSFCCLPAEAGGAFQDQQERADIFWVHHPCCPGDGALPPRESGHASLQTSGAAAAGVAGSAALRHTPPSLQRLSAPSSSNTGRLVMPGSEAARKPSSTLQQQDRLHHKH